MCQDMYQNPETTVFELKKVLDHLTSTILAILPAKLHCRFLQQQQIQALKKWLLRKSSVTEQRISIGASLMGEKHRNIQWKDLNSTSSSIYFTERCFTHRLGGSLGRDENWDMDLAGEKDAHKQTGTSCIKTSPGMLFKSTGNKVIAYSDDPDLLSENGGHKKFTNSLSFKTNMVTAIKEKSSCDSRVPSQYTGQACRHRISPKDRFFRMEASLLSVPKKMGKTLIDLFASRVSH